jgi:hypothetical protein
VRFAHYRRVHIASGRSYAAAPTNPHFDSFLVRALGLAFQGLKPGMGFVLQSPLFDFDLAFNTSSFTLKHLSASRMVLQEKMVHTYRTDFSKKRENK